MKHGRSDYSRIQDPAANAELLQAFIAAYDRDARAALPNPETRRLLEVLEKQLRPVIDAPPENPIGADEPVFLLRASDSIAPLLVREYARICRQRGTSWLVVENIVDAAKSMEEWANKHGAKLPDLPREKVGT